MTNDKNPDQQATITMDRAKVYSILSELFSKDLSVEELKCIGEELFAVSNQSK